MMYKWIWNFLRITGNPERIKELKERANLDGRAFNFEAFIPVDREEPDPKYWYDDSIDWLCGEEAQKEEKKLKFNLKLWRFDHWGIVENAKDAKIKEEDPDAIFYVFKTAYEDIKDEGVDCPAKVARALKDLYPDLDIDWSCRGLRQWSNSEIDFDYYDENGGLLDTLEEPRVIFRNRIMMDNENIEKFKKLYGLREGCFSLAQIIPEPTNGSEEWTDCTNQTIRHFALNEEGIFYDSDDADDPYHLPRGCFVEDIGPALAVWRYENWGTPSEAMYDDFDETYIQEDQFEFGEIFLSQMVNGFYTLSLPPFKIYQKMAADGLVFKAKWESDVDGIWSHGEGQVVDGCFLYEFGPINIYERHLMECYFNRINIVVKNRKHLDQLIECVRNSLCKELRLVIKGKLFYDNEDENFLSSYFDNDRSIPDRKGLFKTADLNFLDVSRVTDMSGLFKDFEVSFNLWRDTGKICLKIKLDISQWDVSNVTKMAHMFDGCENVDFGDLSKWDRSKVTDC